MNLPEIITVEYARSVLRESMIFENGAQDAVRPIVFMVYLIKTEGRLILVDAGCVTMPDFEMEDFIGPVMALEKIGVKAEEITDLIITHAHHDHIECAKSFKNAKVCIQTDEYEAGKKYLEGLDVTLFNDEYIITPLIRVIKIGGHSKGSCIVEIMRGKEKVIIAGDECYKRECLLEKIPTGLSYSKEKSRYFIEEYSKSEYTVLLCHDR